MMSATVALIWLNLCVFVAMTASEWQSLLMFSPALLITFGGSSGIETIARTEVWRLLSSAFVHGGALHFGVNMFVLWKIGPEVEELYGRLRFVVIYLVAAVSGALGSVCAHPLTVDVGASAAIFGIFGAIVACSWRRPTLFPPGHLSLQTKMLVGLLVYSAIFSLIDSTMDHAAHAAGLIAGFVAGIVLLPGTRQAGMRIAALTAGLVSISALAVFLLPKNGAMYFARAAVLHHDGKDKEAIAVLTSAIQCNPDIPVAYNNRAWSENAIADYEAAISDANKAIKMGPTIATTYDTRAVSYILIGDTQKAIADLDKAIKLKSDDGAFYYHRAVAKQISRDETYKADAEQASRLKYDREKWEPQLE
jgi:rhomboid protease GluP